jgi:acetate kinase
VIPRVLTHTAFSFDNTVLILEEVSNAIREIKTVVPLEKELNANRIIFFSNLKSIGRQVYVFVIQWFV